MIVVSLSESSSRSFSAALYAVMYLHGYVSESGAAADPFSTVSSRWMIRRMFPAVSWTMIWFGFSSPVTPPNGDSMFLMSASVSATCRVFSGTMACTISVRPRFGSSSRSTRGMSVGSSFSSAGMTVNDMSRRTSRNFLTSSCSLSRSTTSGMVNLRAASVRMVNVSGGLMEPTHTSPLSRLNHSSTSAHGLLSKLKLRVRSALGAGFGASTGFGGSTAALGASTGLGGSTTFGGSTGLGGAGTALGAGASPPLGAPAGTGCGAGASSCDRYTTGATFRSRWAAPARAATGGCCAASRTGARAAAPPRPTARAAGSHRRSFQTGAWPVDAARRSFMDVPHPRPAVAVVGRGPLRPPTGGPCAKRKRGHESSAAH